jgi:hypothetical protein
MIINYGEDSNRELSYENPRMLIIYGNYASTLYLTKVNEYVAWKRQKGFIVNAVSTSTSGTSYTAIKTYIQNQYNNPDTRPDYIVLIGDTSGTIAVPTYNTYTDYYYTWLAGSDNLGDAVIGRISVETDEQMINYMAKIRSVEKDINIDMAAWLNRALLVGDTASSGISTVYTNEFIHDVSAHVNPDYTYTEVYNNSPSSTTINAALSQGVTFYNYRGYIGMSGWPGTMNSMNNAYRLFHAVFITCSTGSFGGGTSTTESVVRLGTEAALKGAITAIGMATSSTHTPMNNCLDVGIFHSIYALGERDMGTAMLYGKLYLQRIYGVSNAAQALNFSQYCNLIGDPTAEFYVGIPEQFGVSAPTTIPSGTPSVAVAVSDPSHAPVAGVPVVLSHSNGNYYTAFTDASGMAMVNIDPALADSLVLTVSSHDHKPYISTIDIISTGGIVYDGHEIIDSEGGNSNSELDAGETVDLNVALHNTTSHTITITGIATCSDPYVTLLDADHIDYTLAPGTADLPDLPIVFEVASNCPSGHEILILMNLNGSGQSWTIPVSITVNSGNLEVQSMDFVGAPGNVLFPGDQYPLTFSLLNTGLADLVGVSAALRSGDIYVSVTDSTGYFGNIPRNATATNSGNTFTIFARSSCIDGMVIPMELYLYNGTGFTQSIPFTITLGNTTVTDPLGQDAYGYFIYDESDTGYDLCPLYNWIGIAPAEGGSGTALSLSDPGSSYDEGDQVGAVAIQTVNLPFQFQYYGINYSQISVSSNGFIAFGATNDADWRNWRLPDAGGPSPMIAVFWDDLDIVAGTSNVYTYYNSAQHYYVVEWYNMRSGYDGTTPETFQAILYDPAFYPTLTNDGQIKLQYKVFNNIDLGDGDTFPHGNYCTIGIEDHTRTRGLEYTYNNTYPTAAAPLSNESALFISTRPQPPPTPLLVVEQTTITDTNGNAHLEPGEAASLSIRIGNRGLTGTTNVSATLSTSNPYITIGNNSSSYGNIGPLANAYPITPYTVTVSSSCPGGHLVEFSMAISSTDGNWSDTFPLQVYIPELEFDEMTVNDNIGNHDGILDPGETAIITIPLHNYGDVASPAGTATLSCSTLGISILTGSDSFNPIAAGAHENLTFSVSASGAMTDGTLVTLLFNATAGSHNATSTQYIEVGEPLEVIIGEGTGEQSYPVDRYYNYSAHEAIYLASEIGVAGSIKTLAFNKLSGSDVNPIESVTIYMKHTGETSLASGNYSTTGYTLVYSGTFPNNAATGWMGVDLSPMFTYDGVSNLSVLTIKGFQQYINNYPKWAYTSVSPSRARQNRSDSAAPTNLLASANLPNLRLEVFPQVDILIPPNNLSASASHQSVLLNWDAPGGIAPNSYKLYRNSSLLATVTVTTYSDLAVTNGTSYIYHVTAQYTEGESDPSNTASATPNAIPPSNLTAIPGNGVVDLSWTAATGRAGFELSSQGERTISSYRIYRNGTALTTVTGTTYQDTAVTNGTPYTYYVTTLYTNPAGESGPSNSVEATPNSLSFVIIGTGTSVTTTRQNSPVNISNNSCHGQSVYTAAELNAAGVTGPVMITGLGFNVVSTPDLPLPNFLLRMKHTTATSAAEWHSADGLLTTYSAASYTPISGGYDMLMFSTPFQWNGIDNILVDTAFSPVATASQSGTLTYDTITGGYCFAYSNVADQINVFTGGMIVSRRYNIRLAIQDIPPEPEINVSPTSIPFGNVLVNSTTTQQFTIQNSGGQALTGTVTTPTGYTVALAARDGGLGTSHDAESRNVLSISVPAYQTLSYTLTFAPTATASYNGNVVIATNDTDEPTVSIAVTGTGTAAYASVNPTSIPFGVVEVGSSSTQQFTIHNTGNITLTGSITTPNGYTVSLSAREASAEGVLGQASAGNRNTLSISVPAGQSRTYHLTFAPSAATTYNGNVVISTNALNNPTLNVAVTGNGYINYAPIISLPDSFSFDENGTLQVDLSTMVGDTNGDPLTLSVSGNTNVTVQIDDLNVSFGAAANWYGSETLTFTVSDGDLETSDTVLVIVNHVVSWLATPQVTITNGLTGCTLHWAEVSDANGYLIFRSSTFDGAYSQIGNTTQNQFTDSFPLDSAFYKVRAVYNPPAK